MKRGRNSKLYKEEPDPKQTRITNFFIKTSAGNQSASGTNTSGSSNSNSGNVAPTPTSSHRYLAARNNRVEELQRKTNDVPSSDEDDILELEVPPPPPKELISLVSSESEDENDTGERGRENPVPDMAPPQIPPLENGNDSPLQGSSSGDEVLSQMDMDEIILSSSQSQESAKKNLAENGNGERSPSFPGSDSGDEILSQVDIEEMITSSQEKENEKKRVDNGGDSPFPGSDSGDDVMSQIDVDEVIRSSQNSLNQTPDSSGSPSSLQDYRISPSSIPNKENLELVFVSPTTKSASQQSQIPSESGSILDGIKVPKKSPKSELNKFSPLRFVRKRTSSAASLGSPSPQRPLSRSGTGQLTSSTISNSTSPRRKLFDDTSQADRANETADSDGRNPYYLRNFLTILNEVVADPFHENLINPEDRKIVQDFNNLSIHCQCLYVRLFQRKWGWKCVNKINNNYKELPADVSGLCKTLKTENLFEEICASNSNLDEILETLDGPKMTMLGKTMGVNPTKKTKQAIKSALMEKTKSQATLSGSASEIVMKAALKELGLAYRVSQNSKALFSRLFILYSPPHYWEVETDQASNKLLIILLNEMGQMQYPSYKISKSTTIYRTRDDLIRFHEAWCLHTTLVAHTESKEWSSVVQVANRACAALNALFEDADTLAHDSELPPFLRIYTAGSVLSHTCWMGIDGFQKLKQYTAADELIGVLLSKFIYLLHYRGRFYERLAINAGHLKKRKEEVQELLEMSLGDIHLKDNHKLLLSRRLVKIRADIEKCSKNKKKKRVTRRRKKEESDSDSDSDFKQARAVAEAETQVMSVDEATSSDDVFRLVHKVPERIITGEKMDRGPGNMGKSVFIGRQDASGSNRMSSVEQHCIEYYRGGGYISGLHGEGSIITTLFGLLFWDVIFNDSIPDAFHTRYQPFPLDLHFDDFYIRRKELIEEKLHIIREILNMEELFYLIDQVCEENFEKLSIVTWSLVPNKNTTVLKSLMTALGKQNIAKLCERLAKNYRHYSSGFPDLVVWNKETKKALFVEVKGPGDSLSAKQELWLEFLLANGIPCEVCHVKAVSNKRIKTDQ